MTSRPWTRREFARLALAAPALARPQTGAAGRKTEFQIACMTLPYGQFPLERALSGIAGAGFRYVAWGTTHPGSEGSRTPVMPADAPPQRARELGRRCRDLGLEPVMMFSADSRNKSQVRLSQYSPRRPFCL